MAMDYNTQRKQLKMPEYGRHIQKMIEYVASIEDRDKRNEQILAVIDVMGILNPQLRDISDFKHKLWDHVQIISDFHIDIDSPYPTPTRETLNTKPNPIPLEKKPIKAACYGRNIQNMIEVIAGHEDSEVKDYMIKTIAEYMRQQYLIWNKDTVSDETIFNDIRMLSDGRIKIPEGMKLTSVSSQQNYGRNGQSGKNGNFQKNGQNGAKKKKWKKNGNL